MRPCAIRNALLALSVCLCGFVAAFAQDSAAKRPTFDVATIRSFTPPQAGNFIFGRSGGPGSRDPGRITWTGANLNMLLAEAYGVKRYQINGPDWFDSERYDIVAKVPDGATKETVAVMWQNLLADRFGVTFHRIQKEFTVQEMTVAKGGPKFKPTDLDVSAIAAPAAPPPIPPGPPKRDSNGFPQLQGPGLIVMVSPGSNGALLGHMVAKARSMQELADFLGQELNKPVLDKTGLTGRYDFNLEYQPDLAGRGLPPLRAPDGAPAAAPGQAAEPGSNLAAAVQSLGLRLNSAKDMLDVLVIDQANKTPSEN